MKPPDHWKHYDVGLEGELRGFEALQADGIRCPPERLKSLEQHAARLAEVIRKEKEHAGK